MAEITAALVKELRDTSGAGMMDCKRALEEAGGDMDKASEILRKKGIAKAEKRAGRVATQDDVVVARAEARDLQLEVALVRPEPRHG